MAEIDLIERKAVYKALDNIGGCGATDDWAKGYDAAIDAAICIVENTPAADIELVKHGHWEQVVDTKCKCSECEVITMIAQYPIGADKNYCHNCGAKIDDKN